MKYDLAWDKETGLWVEPSSVDKNARHDKNRYFSVAGGDNKDEGVVLIVANESKPYTSKKGKVAVRRTHFCKLADNTREYRENIDRLVKAQESSVHKLCKKLVKEIGFMKLPALKVNLLGHEFLVASERYVKVKLLAVEKGLGSLDRQPKPFLNGAENENVDGRMLNRRPDVMVEASGIGELAIEFYYKHQVDEVKRFELTEAGINCVEVDISALRDNLEASEEELTEYILDAIREHAYWISSSEKEQVLNRYRDMIMELRLGNGFCESKRYRKPSDESNRVGMNMWYNHRLYAFKDTLTQNENLSETHPCYRNPNDWLGNSVVVDKEVEPWMCADCPNCLRLDGFKDDKTENVRVYCRKCSEAVSELEVIIKSLQQT